MSETILLAALLALACAAGVLFGMAFASKGELARLVKRLDKHEVVSAKIFVALSANVAGLRERVEALDGKGSPKEDA